MKQNNMIRLFDENEKNEEKALETEYDLDCYNVKYFPLKPTNIHFLYIDCMSKK